MHNNLRILHCPSCVGGNPYGLAKAERALGYDSWCIALSQTSFEHPADEFLSTKDASLLFKERQRWKLLLRAYWHFDVIHYNFGSSILRWQSPQLPPNKKNKILQSLFNVYVKLCYWIERALLKNKIIAVTFQGDDARQCDYSLRSFQYSIAQEVDEQYYPIGSDCKKRKLIEKFSQMAHFINAVNPDLLHVLPPHTQFMPYSHVFKNDWECQPHPKSKKPIVLHAPSNASAKGTRFIVDAVTQLQHEGIEFEFILVENMKYSEAIKLYQQCDLVIDQLLAGWYGGFAVEAMALGKPVICYIRENDMQYLPPEMKSNLPIIQATPDTICHVLREWITVKRHELEARGIESRQFIECWHDPIKIAQGTISNYLSIN